MTEDILDVMNELPPVIQVLLQEDLKALSAPETAEPILKRGLHRDLRRQADWTFYNFLYPDHEEQPTRGQLIVTPSGALNPLAWSGACDEPLCRVNRAKTFARTVGVWAEVTYIPDVFSISFLNTPRITRRWLERFTRDVAVLRELLPLVRSGVVKFGNTAFAVCAHCRQDATAQAADTLVRELRSEFMFKHSWRPGWLTVESSTVLGESTIDYRIPPAERAAADALVITQNRKRLPRDASALRRNLLRDLLDDRLRDVFLDLRSAQALHSVVVSGTRTDVLCVKTLEQGVPDLRNIDEWEQQREIKIPWVSDLTASEVVRLREQSATALPRFRELVASGLAGAGEQPPKSPAVIVSELRAQAAEVEAELKALGPRVRKRARTTIGLISTGLALYGFGAAGVAGMAALGQLATTLGLIHGFSRTDGTEEAKLKSRPGYVLLKARELLSARGHAHGAG